MYVHQVATCALGGDMCARWRHVRQVEGMYARLGHVRQAGACASLGHVPQVGANVRPVGQYAPRGYMCTRLWHVRQVGVCAR